MYYPSKMLCSLSKRKKEKFDKDRIWSWLLVEMKNVQEVQRHESKLVARFMAGKMQWRYDDGDWRIIKMNIKFYF